MASLTDQPERPLLRRRTTMLRRGFTLVEIMVSLGVLATGTMGGISAFMLLNRYAANLRNTSVARALCQERIEQALTLPLRPPSGTMPMAPNADAATKSTVANLAILGPATVWNATTSAYSGGMNYQSSSETIPIFTQTDGTSANNSANVTYTRTTTLSPSGLTYVNGAITTVTPINVVQFTVNVGWVFHGQAYSTSMTTLRGPD